jgi:signal transduction histidine kinase
MKKLKLQFGLFFFLLALALGFLLLNSYRQMGIEEKSLWVGMSEKVFNQMQATISDFLTQEDGRSFSEYRYYQALPGPGMKEQNLSLSPLSEILAEDDSRGLLGYFQIDPDGSFSTPYLPKGTLEGGRQDLSKRKEKEKELERLAQSLRIEVTPEAEGDKELKKLSAGFVDLTKKVSVGSEVNSPKKEAAQGIGAAALNVYPNPLVQQKASFSKAAKPVTVADEKVPEMKMKEVAPEKAGFLKSENAAVPQDELPVAQNARREVAPNPAQLKAFEAQNKSDGMVYDKSAPAGAMGGGLAPSAPPPSVRASKKGAFDSLGEFSEEKGRDRGPEKEMKKEVRSPLSKNIPEPTAKPVPTYHPPSLLIDPFQARLVSDQYLIFYRKIWIDQKMYLQGFVVRLSRFFEWVMEQSFSNSDLIRFAWAKLQLGDLSLADFGNASTSPKKPIVLFERSLGYPLNAFAWKVYASQLPQLSTRLYLNLFTGIIVLLTTVGLYFIYRSAAAEVVLSQKRQDFVSAVTHELKTPLTSIRMYSEMLEDGWVKEDEKKRDYYRHISKESGRLSHLIDNVLQLARLEKRTYKLNLKKESPIADFQQIGSELKKLADSQGFELVLGAEPDLPPISYDPEALQEIMVILLDNSVKFSKNGFEKILEMALAREGERVAWSWKDRGPGIPPAEKEKIFQKFYRVENELTRSTKGTGIGLAMAHMIMEAMGGEIEARNRDGGGLEVRLSFPI